MIKPYYETTNGKLYHGNCLEIMPELESVNLVLTDPPYGMNNNTDSSRFSGGSPSSHIKRGGQGGKFSGTIIGDDKLFNPVHLIGFNKVILWGANHFAAHLPVGTSLVWIKRLDAAFGSFLSDAEIAWMKGGCGIYCKRDLSLLSNTRQRNHPNEKPVSLFQWCLKKLGEGTVLDPYFGSGTTAITCERLNRRWIGIEISEKYCEIAKQRITNEIQQTKMF